MYPPHSLASEAADQHSLIDNTRRDATTADTAGFQRTTHPDAQWFPQAGLGLFINWGISCVGGQSDISWSMMAQPPGHTQLSMERHGLPAVQRVLTPRAYWAQAEDFQPDRYDPQRWLAAAREAGFTYAVFTARHHDGFAMWPSEYGEFNTSLHLDGRDLVGDYVAACHSQGLKVGLYYSPPDWYWNQDHMSFRYGLDLPALDIDHQPVLLPELSPGAKAEHDAAFRTYVRGQVEELLTRYGKIDLLWFDGHAQDAISIDRIRELQPGIVVNPRGHGYGDFETAECSFPPTQPQGWWEYCHLWADGGWAYLDHEIYKPLGWFLSEFTRTRAWGGNFLASVGPDARGEMPAVYYQRMTQLRDWMAHHRDSVLDIKPARHSGPIPLTKSGNTLYAHLDWLHDGRFEIALPQSPDKVVLMRTNQALPWTWSDGLFSTSIPGDLRTTQLEVVAITLPAAP